MVTDICLLFTWMGSNYIPGSYKQSFEVLVLFMFYTTRHFTMYRTLVAASNCCGTSSELATRCGLSIDISVYRIRK